MSLCGVPQAESVEDSDNPDHATATTVDLDSPPPTEPSLSSLDDDPASWGVVDAARRAASTGPSASASASSASAAGPAGSSPVQGGSGKPAKAKSALRRYVESFDQNTMVRASVRAGPRAGAELAGWLARR